MAYAKKCDRCGRYYDDENSKDKNFRVNGITVHQMALIDACDHPIHEYDLCDQCARDLFHWLCEPSEDSAGSRSNDEESDNENDYLMEEDDLTEEDTSIPWGDKYIERSR